MRPRLIITGASTAAAILQEPRGAELRHLLSFGDPLTGEPRGYREHPARKLRIECDDIERDPPGPDPMRVAITPRQVAAIVDFVRGCDGPTLIHCQAGVSRSTAAGLLLLAVHLPPDEAVAEIRRLRPAAWPNRRIVGLGDELLGLDGALIAADMRWRTIQDRSGIPGYERVP